MFVILSISKYGSIIQTSVDAGELSPEVDQSRQLVDPVLLGVSGVIYLDEGDVQRVRLVVNLLQTRHHLVTLDTVVLVYTKQYFFAFFPPY